MKIDFSNVQKIIFEDENVKKLFPEFNDLFHQWKLGVLIPSLKPTSQKAVLDLLNKLESKHIKSLEKHFQTSVYVEKLDYTLIKNYEIPIENLNDDTIGNLDIQGEMFIYRDNNKVYISTWR